MKDDLLLEVGCENLPSGYVAGGLKQLEALFTEGLASERISYDTLRVLGTPNRLVVHIAGLAGKQAAAEERVVGPPVGTGISPEGHYTKAAEGFAKSQDVPVKRLSTVRTNRGEYLAVIRRIRGRSSAAVLGERIAEWLGNVRFPKAMRWDESAVSFARPIRWICALLGRRVLRIRFGSIVSGRETRLSLYTETPTRIEDVDGYFAFMKENGVVLDSAVRRRTVLSAARRKAARAGGRLVDDEELVDIVANLLETPVAMTGRFDDSFLELPREVIVTALKSHQRYFSIEDEGGRLIPRFVAFADGVKRNKREIILGYERVLQARLADAEFYYKEDTATPLTEMAKRLRGIVWLEGMGTLAQKADRLEKLARFIHSRLGGDDGAADRLVRAARLAKADLASEMVKDGKEFTLLQGYIGREYARACGEDEEVAESLFEHYLPRFAGDVLPRTGTGTVLAIADKLDTIVGCFAAGLTPSGSQDPYALRRHALGILRISVEKRLPIPLPSGIRESLALFTEEDLIDRSRTEELSDAVGAFFTQRFSTMLRGNGFDYDLVNAMLASPWEAPPLVHEMAAELQRMRENNSLPDLVLAMKRISNIIPKNIRGTLVHTDREAGIAHLEALADRREEILGFTTSLFRDSDESVLYDAVVAAGADMIELEHTGGLDGAFTVLSSLIEPINRYFDAVLVNCEDKPLKNNRIAFLSSIYKFITIYCDFSNIAGE